MSSDGDAVRGMRRCVCSQDVDGENGRVLPIGERAQTAQRPVALQIIVSADECAKETGG
jgi:hypothetical protein